MVWIYLAESGESHLPYTNGSSQLPTVKSTNTARQFFCQECLTGNCQEHLFGTTLCHLMDTNSMDILISYTVASLAKTSVAQDLEKAWKESEADYFLRSCAWPKKSSPRTYSLKTCQQSQAEGGFKSLEKLPKWGMIVDGVLYPLQALERYTVENDGSCWLTPSTMEHLPVRTGAALERSQRRGNSTSKRKCSGRLNEQVAYQEMWPVATPTASQASKPIRAPSPTRQNGTHGEDLQDSIGRLNPSSIGKKLCVRWTSVLMGYHITYTDLEPWAMRWFQSK